MKNMSVVVFHGDDTFSSYQALSLQIAQLKNSETLVHKLDGKTLTSEEFLSLSNQEDFFIFSNAGRSQVQCQ